MRRLSLWLSAAMAAGSPAAALAHAFLDHALPPVGATVAASPVEIRLFFSEAIEPRFSGIELTPIDGYPVKAGPAIIDPRDRRQLVLPVPALPSGRYKVSWHVVSVDTHRTQGDFTFEIKP
jgi:methionine-rich copper-binding protein CopC